MTPEEARLAAHADDFARANRRRIARELTDPDTYSPEDNPVAVFMAGSPGAGKTEASDALSRRFGRVLRIDPDELRALFPGYCGGNAWVYQRATTKLVEKVVDEAFDNSQTFILDGTLSNYEVAQRNVRRALRAGRVVQIVYVYQDPIQAWQFVRQREAVEGRSLPKDQFIEQYFGSRRVVNRLKEEFGTSLYLDVIMKNIDGTNRHYHRNVNSVDPHIPECFTPDTLTMAIEPL